MSMMDGPDELHKVVIANMLMKRYTPHEGCSPANTSQRSAPRPARSSST
jgi:hypothetical protein